MKTRKQILLGLGITFPIIVIIALTKFFQVRAAIAEHANFAMPPEAITTAKAEFQEWGQTYSAIGSVSPINGAVLAAEVIGRVAKVQIESGQDVTEGTIIVSLDTEVEDAQLKESQARLERAKKRVDRYEAIKNTKALSPEVLDDALMEYKQAAAAAESLKAVVRRKNIVAPFSGTLGIRKVSVGQVLIPGSEVVPLYSLDQLYVDFTLPQQTLPNLTAGASVTLTVDTYPGETFSGKVSAIDSRVSDTTRNIAVQATVENRDRKLRPGMFANVNLILPTKARALVIPATSVNYAPYGDSVYVVSAMKDEKGKDYFGVTQKIVQLGEKRGDLVTIASGLAEGEEVASSGVFKLRPGASVFVNNSLQPSQSLTPTPADT